MEKIVITATKRTVTGKQVRALRREGKLPGVLYGHNFVSQAIQMDLRDATKLLHGATGSSIINIDLDGTLNAALVREKQRDFIKGTLKHVDFQVVSLTEKLRAKVSIEIVGTSPAVKDFNGNVVIGLDQVEVECLPQYLPEKIVLNISKLGRIGDGIYVRDLDLDKNILVHNHAEEMIVVVTLPMADEEAVEGTGAIEPEVIEKGKKPEEEE